MIFEKPTKNSLRNGWRNQRKSKLIFWVPTLKGNEGVDPLVCQLCRGSMRVIAVIEDQKVIRKILAYLGLWQIKARPRPLAMEPRNWPLPHSTTCHRPAPTIGADGRDRNHILRQPLPPPEAGSYPKKKVSFAKRQGTCYFFPDATDIQVITKKIDYLHLCGTDSEGD
jgi:hypothetical protein